MTVILLMMLLLIDGAAYPSAALSPDTMALQCSAFQHSRGLCEGLRSALQPRTAQESRTLRLTRARQWMDRTSVQRQARSLTRRSARAPRTVAQQLDLGLAQLVTGRIGEGMHHVLNAYRQAPQQRSAADLVYLGFLVSMDRLNPDQRIDWAADVASRLTGHWRLPASNSQATAPQLPPRSIDIARAIHLAELANDADAVRQFARFGQAYYPHDDTWTNIAARLPTPAQQSSSAERGTTPHGDRN